MMRPSIAPLFTDYPVWFAATFAVVLTIVIASLVAEVVARLVRLAIRGMFAGSGDDHHVSMALARAVKLVRVVIGLLVLIVLIFPALELVGLSTSVGIHPQALAEWLFQSGLRVGLILLVSFLLVRIVTTITTRLERDVESAGGPSAPERLRRARTLGRLIRSTLGTLVSVIALLMILRELNLDITPILTGAGIVGLAVGFGAQSLVKDVISGFFLILENQVRVGDVAAINGTSGQVEAISLRTVVLRDGAGTVHVFPNGSINTLSNQSKDYSFYGIDLAVPYGEDPDRIIGLIKEIGRRLQEDPVLGPSILAPIEVFGVDAFTDSQMTVKFRIKTLPLKQWETGRELRRRIVKRFADEGITLARPTVTTLQLQPGVELVASPSEPHEVAADLPHP